MKLLNLDPLVKSVQKRLILVDGVEHEICSLNVEQFLLVVDETKDIAEKSEKGEFTIADEVRLTMKVVAFAVPTLSEDQIKALKLDQLQAIAAFAKGDDVAGVEEVKEKAPEETEGK
ncbi:hypothetical protein [Acinetobacter nosocomialis]|uniref:hypothetical protein n=1 Tax=Acinetobacter nosocomialis TaxID=106654 RepID=UPI0033B55732